MATVTAPRQSTALVTRIARRSLWLTRELPVISLLVLAVLTFVAIFAPVLAPHSKLDPVKPSKAQCMARYEMTNCPYVDNLPPFWLPQGNFSVPLGTDYLGRDILSRLMYGARISLIVALAGYLGGWWDQIIMRITDAWLTLPSLVFAILLSSVRGPGLWNVVLILTLVFWSRYARIVRGGVLGLREQDFVKLAEINGVKKRRIIWRHIIPNVMNTVMVVFSLQIGVAVIIEASLSFLGVGVPPPEPSWGLMMAQERESLMEGRWWLAVFPGVCITFLVLSANMLGDWLRVRLDPQLRNR